jgi:peptidoglycan/xylan/chitin deacetylase (PgdA/CDA1 family)
MVLVSFSWDDGAVEDLKLMDLALKFNVPSLFFIPVVNSERSVMAPETIKTIDSNNFEIGAHTFSHSYLTNLPIKKAREEIITGKDFLEQLLGKEVRHFSFPGGKYNDDLIEISKKYFKSARTADTGAIVNKNIFLIKPTFHFYNRGKKSLIYNSIKNLSVVYGSTMRNLFSNGYFNFVKDIIADLHNYPGTHRVIVWGHSWEIENCGLWYLLEDLFQWISTNYPLSLRSYSDLIDQ